MSRFPFLKTVQLHRAFIASSFVASLRSDLTAQEYSSIQAGPVRRYEKRANSGWEVRATLALTLFVLSQWALPQALLLQNAKGRTGGIGSAQAAEPASSKTSASSSAEPGWYRADRLENERRKAQMEKHGRLRVAQNTTRRGTVFPSATIERVGGAGEKARAVSGPPLIEGAFPTELRASAPLPTPPDISHFFLDLSNDRVPSQAEIVAMGSLAGALSPVAPAEAEVFAAQIDKELREAGFEQGLNTEFPTPDQAIARGLPGIAIAAKNFGEAKKRVKEARDQTREFARAMQKWNRNQFKEATEEFEEYLKKYPKSPWTPEAMIHVANYAKYTGRGNESEDLYRQVIEMTSNDPAEMSYNAHRKAFGRLTDLYLIEGRYGEVRPMLEDLLYNDTNWSRRTWGLYWLTQINALQNDPKRLLAERDCGTQALAALLAQTGHPHEARAVEVLKPTDPRGFSLADLHTISAQRGVPLVGFEGTTAQLPKLPLPLLLHYGRKKGPEKIAATPNAASPLKTPLNQQKQNTRGATSFEHFVLVKSYDARRDVWNVLNAQDGMSATLTSAQLAREWSGRGLMLTKAPKKRAGKSPIPSFAAGLIINASLRPAPVARPQGLPAAEAVKRLSLPEMRTTFGIGYAVKGQANIGFDSSNEPVCGDGGCPPSLGSPSVSINPISQNIHVTDTPVWYSPAKGPDVQITLSYNSLDASNYNRKMGGNKWSVNYGSYVVQLPGRAIVYMPDGAQLTFINPAPNDENPNNGDPNGSGTVNQDAPPTRPTRYISPRGVDSTLIRDNRNGTFKLITPEGEQMFFSRHPHFLDNTIYDTTVSYLQTQTDQWGQSLTFDYQTTGNYENLTVPASITDADGRLTTLNYDVSGRMISAQTPDGKQATFSYDASGNMIQCVDVAGEAFQYSYNSEGILSQLNTIQGSWDFLSIESANSANSDKVFRSFKTKITNPAGNARVIGFQVDNSTPSYHNPGHYYSTSYRSNQDVDAETIHDLATHNNASYNETVYSVQALAQAGQYYDFNNRISSVTYPSGLQINYSYDDVRHFLPTSVVMPGLTTKTTYNVSGRPEQIIQTSNSGASRTVDILYHSGYRELDYGFVNLIRLNHEIDVAQVYVSGKTSPGAAPLSETVFRGSNYISHQPQTITNAAGHRTDITYRFGEVSTVRTYEETVAHTSVNTFGTSGYALDRVVGVSYDGVAMSAYQYDASGRVSSATDVPTGLITRTAYNALDSVVSTTYPDDTADVTEYLASNLPGVVTDRSGKKTYYGYDNLKRLVRVQDADGQTLQFGYDVDGNRTSLVDARGQETLWAINEQTRTLTKTYANGQTESTQMAVQGWPLSSTNGRGATTQYSHNDFGEMTGIDFPNAVSYLYSPNHSSDVSFSYDELGRRTAMLDGVGQTQWAYDSSNRVTFEDGPWDYDYLNYAYDEMDRLYGVSVSRSAISADTRIFGYDALSRLSSLQATTNDHSMGTFHFAYQGNSDRLERLDRPNGTQTLYNYESAMLKRFVGVQNRDKISGANHSSFTSGYNSGANRDNRSFRNSTYGTEATQGMGYGYNMTSMLLSERAGTSGTPQNPYVKKFYSYDGMGNRLSTKNEGALTQVDSSYNALNQLTGQSSYDIAGGASVLTGTSSYGYDGDGNQSVVTTSSSGSQSQTQYAYDDQSRLVSLETAGVSRTEFVYDGLSRLRISRNYSWNAGNGTWTRGGERWRIYDGMDVVQDRDQLNRWRSSIVRAGNIGGILARNTHIRSTLFYAYDMQGNVTTLTDGTRAVVASYAYDAFGNTVASSGADAAENPYRFSTKEQIGGLYYFGYRFYNPGTGRWVNRDPIEEDGGVNLYGFVGNNPIKYVDPYGESPTLVTGAIGVAGGALIGGGVAWWRGENIAQGAFRGGVIGGVVGLTGGLAGGAVYGGVVAGGGSTVAAGVAGGAIGGVVGDVAGQGTELALGWRCGYSPWQTAGAGATGGGLGRLYGAGREIKIGPNWRFAPFGNRTGHPQGELPHYHRRGPFDPVKNQTIEGQGIGRHRPWEVKPNDTGWKSRW